MDDPSSFAETARATLADALLGTQDALDGFPIRELLEHYLTALESASPSVDRSSMLALATVGNWIARLNADVDAFPSAANDAVARLTQRLLNTRGALVNLEAQLLKFERLRLESAGPAMSGPATQSRHWMNRRVRRLSDSTRRAATSRTAN